MSQFDIKFIPRPTIKGQALVDFIVEFTTTAKKQPQEALTIPTAKIPKWGLYVDEFSNEEGSGAGLIFVHPDGHQMHYTGSGSKPPTIMVSMKH